MAVRAMAIMMAVENMSVMMVVAGHPRSDKLLND
jgi:hypothetical protein